MDSGNVAQAAQTSTNASSLGMGGGKKIAGSGTELSRLYSALEDQAKLLSILTERLQPVLHPSPPTDEDIAAPGNSHHIADAAYRLELDNRVISQLINDLAV